jgi:hypothetical protein
MDVQEFENARIKAWRARRPFNLGVQGHAIRIFEDIREFVTGM